MGDNDRLPGIGEIGRLPGMGDVGVENRDGTTDWELVTLELDST
jgi:hypothetical protein